MRPRSRHWPYFPRSNEGRPSAPEEVFCDGRIAAFFSVAPPFRTGRTADGSVAFVSPLDRRSSGTVVTFEAHEFSGRAVACNEPLVLGRLSIAPAPSSTICGTAILHLGLEYGSSGSAPVPLKRLVVPLDHSPATVDGDKSNPFPEVVRWSDLLSENTPRAANSPTDELKVWRTATLLVNLPATGALPAMTASLALRVLQLSPMPNGRVPAAPAAVSPDPIFGRWPDIERPPEV